MKAIKQIRIGEQITINYCDIELPKNERQERLRKSFYFDCNCHKCLSNDYNIDYKHFESLNKELKKELNSLNPNWPLISGVTTEMIVTCNQIYGKFHPESVSHLIPILRAKLQNKLEDNQSLNRLICEVRYFVELIFGTNHSIYKYLLKEFHSISSLNNKI